MKNILYYLLIITAMFGYSFAMPFLPQLYLFHIIFFLLLSLILLTFLLKGKIKIKMKNVKFYFYFFLVWFLWILISFLWANDKSLAVKFTLIYIIVFSFLWVIVFYNKDKNIFKCTLKVLFFISLLALLIGTLEAFTNFRLPVSPYFDIDGHSFDVAQQISVTPTSFFYNPNNYAVFLVLFLPFILFGIEYISSKKKKIVFFLIAFLIVINVIMTDSRINILSCVFVLLIYLLFSLLRGGFSFSKTLKYFFIFLAMMPLVFFLINSNDYLKNRFEDAIYVIDSILSKKYILDRGGDSLSIRMTILKKIIFPPSSFDFLFGFGVGNSRDYLREQNLPRQIIDPHNWWLEILGDFGFIFFLWYLIFFISLLRSLWKIIKRRKERFITFTASSCFFSLLGFTISSMGPSSVAYFFPHWILMGISIITINLFKD